MPFHLKYKISQLRNTWSLPLYTSVVVKIWSVPRWWHVFKLLRSSPRHPQLSDSTLKPQPHSAFPELPTISKTWPRVAFRHSETFITPRLLLLRSLHRLRVFSTRRPSPFWRLRFRSWSSNNTSSLISAGSYATPSFLMFIMCNTPINAGSYEQWQIFWHAIPTNQRRWSRLLQQIQYVQIVQLQQSINSSSTPASMLGIYYLSSPRRGRSLP